MRSSLIRAAFSGALITVIALFGGLLLGVAFGNLAFDALPRHLNEPLRIALAATPALSGMVIGSAVWGVLMGRLARATQTRRMGWTGVAGFVPITLALGIALQIIEPIAVARWGDHIPMHRLFTLLFVPTAFLIASAGSLALGFGLRKRALAWALAWRAGVAAALAFLAVNLVMEALGWQVGAPRAAERFTMLTVMFVSDLGSAALAGAVVGVILAREAGR